MRHRRPSLLCISSASQVRYPSVFVEMLSCCALQTVPCSDSPLPSQGRSGGYRCLSVATSCCDSPPSFPLHFVVLRSAVPLASPRRRTRQALAGSGEPSGCVCLALQLRLVLSRLAVKDDAEPGVAVGGPLQPVAHSVSRLLVSPPSQRVDAAPDAGRPRARASSHFRTHSLGLRARRVRFAGLQRGFVNSSTLISSHPGLACRKTQSGSIPARRGERSTEEAAMTLYGGSLPRVYHLVSVRRGSTS
jgi:hypothetical protein